MSESHTDQFLYCLADRWGIPKHELEGRFTSRELTAQMGRDNVCPQESWLQAATIAQAASAAFAPEPIPLAKFMPPTRKQRHLAAEPDSEAQIRAAMSQLRRPPQ